MTHRNVKVIRTRTMADALADALAGRGEGPESERDREIFRLYAAGYTFAEIARRVGLSYYKTRAIALRGGN
jgi:DNA-binding CsgD family transcriptional regulator